MDPILRPFRPEDLRELLNRDGPQGLTEQAAREYVRRGPGFTAVVDGHILGAAGILLASPGVGVTWMTVREEINGHGVWLTRTVAAVLDDVARLARLHRLEAVALHESLRNQRWLEVLGFTREQDGVARAYTPDGRDMIRYERVRR